MLTEHERRVLEELAARTNRSDPALVARLQGRRVHGLGPAWRRARPALAAASIPGGLAFTITTFTASPWAGLAGVLAVFWGAAVHTTDGHWK